ncbi:MAG: TolC family protein, partial [Bryobacterales bacterium]|nr:TolC family protein [Bryobacterales bacterium]
MKRSISRTLALLFFGATFGFAQLGPSTAPAQGSLATQLPLSGRGGQNGSVTVTQSPVPGTTTSVNTLNTSVQASGPYAGSASSITTSPFSGKLSLRDAIQRGLDYNLGTVGMTQAVRQARGQTKVARSSLLPNLIATASETEQQTNLAVVGIRFNSPIPGFSIPSVVGPFNYFDLRARLTQTVADMTVWKNYRSAEQTARANELSMKDARDMVVLAVGGAYLQVIAAKARVDSAKAQLDTANALFQQTSQQRGVGLVAQTDVNRSRVQMLTQQERIETLRNDLAKQKINLARLTGLPANDQFDITDEIPYSPA